MIIVDISIVHILLFRWKNNKHLFFSVGQSQSHRDGRTTNRITDQKQTGTKS